MPKIPPWRQILKPILSWFRANIFPNTLNSSFKGVIQWTQMTTKTHILRHSNEVSMLSFNSFSGLCSEFYWGGRGKEKAHFREQMLWFIHPACWSLQRANPHLWFRFIAGESINPYCFLLISCHIYFSLHLPPSGHACLLCMFPHCLIIF